MYRVFGTFQCNSNKCFLVMLWKQKWEICFSYMVESKFKASKTKCTQVNCRSIKAPPIQSLYLLSSLGLQLCWSLSHLTLGDSRDTPRTGRTYYILRKMTVLLTVYHCPSSCRTVQVPYLLTTNTL